MGTVSRPKVFHWIEWSGLCMRWGQPRGRDCSKTTGRLETKPEDCPHLAGIGLARETVDRALALVDKLAPGATTSLQRDVAAGRPSELEAWTGAIVRLGQKAEVETPLNRFLYHCLLPLELRARGELAFPE